MYIQAYKGLQSIILAIFTKTCQTLFAWKRSTHKISNAFPRQWFYSALLTLSWQSLLRPELFYQQDCFTLKSAINKKCLV